MLVDEVPPWPHVTSHQGCQNLVCFHCVLHSDLEQGPLVRVHGSFPQLVRHHFPQPLEPLQGRLGGSLLSDLRRGEASEPAKKLNC